MKFKGTQDYVYIQRDYNWKGQDGRRDFWLFYILVMSDNDTQDTTLNQHEICPKLWRKP